MANENYEYIVTTGLVVPNTQTVRDQVADEYTAAFGQDFITDARTPQGVLITTEAIARAAVLANDAALANQINPRVAEGVFLDAIGALTGFKRESNDYTLVTADLTGQPGTVIPVTAGAQIPSGVIFAPVTQIQLDLNGLGTVVFKAEVPGAFQVNPGDLNTIAPGRGVLGWETVDNDNAGSPGSLQEGDSQFRNKRNNSLALQGVALTESAKAALVAANIGVTSSSQFENYTGSPLITPDGAITVPAHTMYYCIDGGSDYSVAEILRAKKSAGCGWHGDVEVDVVDPATSQVYHVKFDRPTYVPILLDIRVKLTQAFQGDADKAVKTAILAYVNGELSDEPGLQIQTAVSCFEIAGAVNIMYPGLFVVLCQARKASDPTFSSDTIPILINERATIQEGSINVIIVS